MNTVTITTAEVRKLKATTSSIVSGVKIENEHGFWAILRFDPQGGRYGYGVYFVEASAPYYPEHIPSDTLVSNQHRDVCERHMRNWLKKTA